MIGLNKVKQYDFSGRRVLLCEDHPLNIEVAKNCWKHAVLLSMLQKTAVRWKLFTLSQPGYYDAVLSGYPVCR